MSELNKVIYPINISEPNETLYRGLTSLARYVSGCKGSSLSFPFKDTISVQVATGVPSGEMNIHSFLFPTENPPLSWYIMEDTGKENHYSMLCWVKSAPFVRFCAGFPLIEENNIIGYLNIYDDSPRRLSAEQINALEILSVQVMALLKKESLDSARLKEEMERKDEEIKILLAKAASQKKFHEDILNKKLHKSKVINC